MQNAYKPYLMTVDSIRDETPDVRSLRLVFRDPEVAESFTFRAGQFAEYSVFGEGECVFCIASPPTRHGYVECSFKLAGKVTSALRDVEVGDVIGFRGPYGNWFPIEEFVGHNMLFIGGGIGMAPVRSIFLNVLDQREQFKEITILNGARSVADLVYKDEVAEWQARPDIRCVCTVDPGGEDPTWQGEVGFIPTVLERMAPPADDTYAVLCGPPIMIKLTLQVLEKLGFPPERVYTTLENKMKCGFGKCGRCNVGPVYVCKDGPVFSAAQLQSLPPDF